MNISDSHNDFLTTIDTADDRECYIKDISSIGVTNISCAVFTTERCLTVKDVIRYSQELGKLKRKYNINLILSIEDLGFVTNKYKLQKIVNLKPFSVTLTWNEANQFGGGAHTKLGLTPLGKTYVKILEQNNILIDTAHMSNRLFWDFCKITTFPIYNSHSNIYSLKHHKRNLTDKQIEHIVQSNGYLGLTLYDEFISQGNITSHNVAKQFDYLIQKFGNKNFGLGTDFYGISTNRLPNDIKGYAQINNLINKLKLFGYDNEIIDCIIFKNFEDFLIRMNNINR